MINIIEKEKCTGCRACELMCPKNCIQMIFDDEGFLYPTVDNSTCIDCGLCDRVCHMNKENDSFCKFGGEIFVGINKDQNERLASSSGGIFSLLAKEILSDEGVVYGAGFDNDFKVIHKRCDSVDDLPQFRGSKYVQSDLNTTFKDAKYDLEEGKKVFFTGTPCQIGALKSFLCKEYDNLYTQSFICHGVPSPKVWKKYLEYILSSNNKKISKIKFRDKTYGWSKYSLKFSFSDDTEYISEHSKNDYSNMFLKNTCLRPSCHSCHYKTFKSHSLSDITLADWWGMQQGILPEACDDKGASVIIANTQKGMELLNTVKDYLVLKPASYEQTVAKNPSYFCSAHKSIHRDDVFANVCKMPFDKLSKKYASTPIYIKLKNNALKITYKVVKKLGLVSAVKKILKK